jgi:signal transduction histidine kinase
MSRIITALLTLARADAARDAPTEVDLPAIVGERVDNIRYLADQRHLKLELERGGEPAIALANEEHVGQVIDNLLANAIAVSPQDETVTIAVRSNGEGVPVHVEISDHGQGMTSDQLSHAFDRFWRSPTATGQGSGLGLSIVRKLVEADHAQIDLRDRADGGLVADVTYLAVPAP